MASHRIVGWLFVAIQAVLLVTVVVLPGGTDWPTPAWLQAAGLAVIAAGLAVMAVAALRLGSALTPTPMPNDRGPLRTDGLYQYVRHPIYSGVLLAVVGLAIRSGRWFAVVVAGATIGFFHIKARWEEARLAEHYPDYPSYAAATPRFVPRRIGRRA